MDPEIKREFQVLGDKFDTAIANQREILEEKIKPVNEHIKDGPHFRDKIVKLGESLKINWVLTLLMVSGAIGGFFWLLRSK